MTLNSQPALVIFLSAVSSEFHQTDPKNPRAFLSYRGVLAEAFRRAGLRFQIIVQEELPQGLGDLLQTLDNEVSHSALMIHIVGDGAGSEPQPAEVRRLRQRHGDFLVHEPELRDALGEFAGLSYTQWEIYLAFHYDLRRLVFVAQPDTARSPAFKFDAEQKRSQEAHLSRLKLTGEHREEFEDQRDLVLKAFTSVIRYNLAPAKDEPAPTPDAISKARADSSSLANEIATSYAKPDRHRVPVEDTAGVAAYADAVDRAAAKRGLDRRATLQVLDEHETELEANAETNPTYANLRELAFGKLALGDTPAARRFARRAADLAIESLRADSANAAAHRQDAINAFFLLSDVARAARNLPNAIAALEEGGAFIDRDKEPLFWADYHAPLAEYYLEQYRIQPAEALINELVDIHEAQLSENDPKLGYTLLRWARLLEEQAKYKGQADVSARAANIFRSQGTDYLPEVASALSSQGSGLMLLNNFSAAEPLMRQALAIDEQNFGREHTTVARDLNNLAQLLQTTNRLAEAEPLMRRSLGIDELHFGLEHTIVARDLNNLAHLLQTTNRLAEAEPLMRRALAINEQCLGEDHPNVAKNLNNLVLLLQATNRLIEAEPLMRRALATNERCLGENHPDVALNLNNLGQLLQATNRLTEAEPLLRRALAINEQSFGPNHPNVALNLNNLGQLLQATNRLTEAELLTRRALAINEQSFGPNHPNVALNLNNVGELLQQTDRLVEAEPLLRRALAINEQCLGENHPYVALILNNLGQLLQETGRLTEAEPLMRRALAIYEQSFGPNHPNVAMGLDNLGQLLQETGRLKEAEPLLRRALEIG